MIANYININFIDCQLLCYFKCSRDDYFDDYNTLSGRISRPQAGYLYFYEPALELNIESMF